MRISPYTQELDIDINREGLLERVRLLPSYFVFLRVHLVGKGDLLVIAWW